MDSAVLDPLVAALAAGAAETELHEDALLDPSPILAWLISLSVCVFFSTVDLFGLGNFETENRSP